MHVTYSDMCLKIVTCFLVCCVFGSTAQLCTSSNFQTVARIVFGEARGEPERGRLAVAYTIVNRVGHRGYLNTVHGVAHQTYNHGRNHQYNTLDLASHNRAWATAKRRTTRDYNNAIKAAKDALCKRKSDPTGCAVDFCARRICSSIRSNKYWRATNKIKIGKHYFVCRKKW